MPTSLQFIWERPAGLLNSENTSLESATSELAIEICRAPGVYCANVIAVSSMSNKRVKSSLILFEFKFVELV
ncbi:MAG: hypothetical protein AMXMBFR51_10080 [Ignavibacteriota bacterium]